MDEKLELKLVDKNGNVINFETIGYPAIGSVISIKTPYGPSLTEGCGFQLTDIGAEKLLKLLKEFVDKLEEEYKKG